MTMVEALESQKAPDGKIDNTVVELLCAALTNKDVLHEPWASGVVNLSGPETTLFYERQDGTASSLRLGSSTTEQVEDLTNACQPATFGLNQKNVLDETYRKAGKLDVGNFLWGFNPDTGSFASTLASGLFPWGSLDRGIRFELYKLNVYGKGGFFKTHQDTPRGEDMFGSLVILLPFEHEGGNLLLKHHGREYDFNRFALLKAAPPTSAAYVAFFSDIEHEVTEVVSGHRVTITYNLYFDPNKGVPVIQVPRDAQLEHPFKATLRECLDHAATQPVPSHLGFGLVHAYPIESALFDLKSLNLKGSDAILVKTLKEANVEHLFFLLYRERKDNSHCPFRVLSTATVHGYIEEEGPQYDTAFDHISGGKDSFLVWDEDEGRATKNTRQSNWYYRYERHEERFKSLDVKWVTEPSEECIDWSTVITYGNAPSLGYYYHQLCLIANVSSVEGASKENESLGNMSKGNEAGN